MLYKEDTNWLELVDAVRRDRATVLLARGLSRTAVAARLGFSYAGRCAARYGAGTATQTTDAPRLCPLLRPTSCPAPKSSRLCVPLPKSLGR